jgi:tetratricopeptide (TPR) repeat protein
MIRFFLLVLGLLTFSNSQKIDHFFVQIERGEVADVRKTLPTLLKKYPNNPGLKYLSGLTLTDGDSALKIFKEIVNNHSKSKFAEGASSKIGQYLYSRGLYSQASQHFKKFIFDYPQSDEISRTMGLMIRSFDATGELDTAQIVVDQFFKKYTKISLVKNELGYIPDFIKRINVSDGVRKKEEGYSPKIPGNWMVQVGAFGVRENAINLENKLKKNGYSASINQISSKKTLFAVRVGPFVNRKNAKKRAVELKNNFGLDYQLIEIP